MKYFIELSVFFILCIFGSVISYLTDNFIPGNVCAMILLLMLLVFKAVKLPQIEKTGDFLLENMGLFYLPGCISIMSVFSEMKSAFLPIIIICVITTVLVALATGYTVMLTIKCQNFILNRLKRGAK